MSLHTGHVDAIADLVQALDQTGTGIGPDEVPLHLAPMDQRPIGLPSILIAFPEIGDHVNAGCGDPRWEFTHQVTVISESVVGSRLAGICDAVLAVLDAAGYRITQSTRTTYDPPDSPSPIPAVSFIVE